MAEVRCNTLEGMKDRPADAGQAYAPDAPYRPSPRELMMLSADCKSASFSGTMSTERPLEASSDIAENPEAASPSSRKVISGAPGSSLSFSSSLHFTIW